MRALAILAGNEIRDGLRNRWVAALILLLAGLALSLALLGSAPSGTLRATPMSVTVASLASLTVYLLPLVALLLAFDALVGEQERGTLLLLLTYPVARWQVVLGKFLGHSLILLAALLVGYGGAGLLLQFTGGADAASWGAYLGLLGSSWLLGSGFIALGYLVSALVRERATAAGAAIVVWLLFVVLYDLALLGLLLADTGQGLPPGLVAGLLLVNPTDVYRILNLTGTEAVSLVAGMAEAGRAAGYSPGLLVGLLCAWVVLPLGLTVARFQRREL
ncbi:MAG TPA: ABC transporter permease subunit [Gammaproteobacteria bacterium]